MTLPAYTADEDGGIDVTVSVGKRPWTEAEQVAFARYHTAFQFAAHWPDVEHFRRAVVTYDELVALNSGRADDGADQEY